MTLNGIRKHKRRTVVLGGLVACVMVFIFAMSAMPGDESAQLSGFFVHLLEKAIPPFGRLTGDARSGALDVLSYLVRKGAHFTEYAVLGGLITAVFHSRGPEKKLLLRGLLIALLVGALYAVSDEVHQHFVPGRAMAALDVCIDSGGVFLGTALVTLFTRNHSKA